jgi:hypothetical protein
MMDYTVILPPGWVRIPLDGRENTRAAALAAAKAAEVAEPQRQAARQKLQQLLRRALRDARSAGGVDILLSLGERNGIPLTASCLISYTETRLPVPLEQVMRQLTERGGDVSEAKIGGRLAVRHRYAEAPVTHVDYHLRVPGHNGLLIFAYATPLEPLADAMATLFDAITETLRWH